MVLSVPMQAPSTLSAASLSALGCMRSLSVEFSCSDHHVYQSVVFSPLYALTSLATLRLRCTGPSRGAPVEVYSDFTAPIRLSQIETLGVLGCDVVLKVEWQVMPKLQSLTLQGKLHCDKQMLGLSRLSSLKYLDMSGCELGNDETTNTVNMLVYNMKTHCPYVKVLLEGMPSSNSDSSVAPSRLKTEQANKAYDYHSFLAEMLA